MGTRAANPSVSVSYVVKRSSMFRRAAASLLGGMLALGLVAADTPADPVAPGPNAVVAFLDTGINPYHVVFRDDSPRAFAHPSTYLEGFPAEAEALELSFGARSYAEAVRADCDIWAGVEPGKLYWFPGTRIIGGIRFGSHVTPNCNANRIAANILDTNGHGTMVASRGAGAGYGACEDCLIVAVQTPMSASFGVGYQPPEIDAVEWLGENATWIDAQSNSWGPIAPGYDPTSSTNLLVTSQRLVEAVEASAQRHLAFWASMNGTAYRAGVVGHPTALAPHLTPSAISVGGHDSGYVAVWPGWWPHIVSDACDAWAAHDDSITKSDDDVAGGTSGATPFAAGGAARILLEARRILEDASTGVADGVVARGEPGLVSDGPLADGEFTLAEWRSVTFATATPRPKAQFEDGPGCGLTSAPYNHTGVKWENVPAAYPEYIHIGYGAVDRVAMSLAFDVLAGSASLPDRSATDAFFELDDTGRRTLHDVWTTF